MLNVELDCHVRDNRVNKKVFFAVGKGGKFLNELWYCISAQGHYKKIWLSTEVIR